MASASIKVPVQCRLAWYARWLLIVSALSYKYLWMRVPHSLVKAITNRSWRMRIGNGPWKSIRIDDAGRIVK
jgi:hypothetical protein